MGLILHGDGDRIVIRDLCSETEASSRPGGRLDRERLEGHSIDARPAAQPAPHLRGGQDDGVGRMLTVRPHGAWIPKSRQIFRARNSLISRCRGTADT